MFGPLLAFLPVAATPIWAPTGVADGADSHVAFRGRFVSKTDRTELRIVGASEYLVWLDGVLIHDGPARFAVGHPEFQRIPLRAAPGSHVLAVHVRNNGVTTRILSAMKPFLWCSVSDAGSEVPIGWKCARIPGYRAQSVRISDILGWADRCDSREVWPDWNRRGFDDSSWKAPLAIGTEIGELIPAKTSPVKSVMRNVSPIAAGKLATTFGYESDDPAVRFFLAELRPKTVPSQGVWRRYDLGRVRLGRPAVTLDVAPGTVVEIAICEALHQGRVHPWITLSGSRSCNLDRFIARGGVQEFMPFTPKGGRFFEVHVLDPKGKFVRERFLERTYFGAPVGTFACSDPILDRIWRTGVDTVRACSEDALVDCPTRERGQWTGDVASVASEIVAVAFGDLSLTRRALVQAAQAARPDGLVAGVGPGDPGYLSTYAAQWTTACVRYWELSGDRSLLEELLPAARRNMAAFEAKRAGDGVSDDLGWAFVDWGYVRNAGPSDRSLDLHYLMCLRSMARWERAVGADSRTSEAVAQKLQSSLTVWLNAQLGPKGDWVKVGYQRAALALLAGIVPKDKLRSCTAWIKRHLSACFPNDPDAPRLSDPGVSESRIMTPYFCHFAFAALLSQGEVDFVLGQYRTCWGWALKAGLTTWPEVFDLRWSHCHEWSGCPTWQLSRFVLGLRPRFDLGERYFELDPNPGSLTWAEGDCPIPSGGTAHVAWRRKGVHLTVTLRATSPITVQFRGKAYRVATKKTFVTRTANG